MGQKVKMPVWFPQALAMRNAGKSAAEIAKQLQLSKWRIQSVFNIYEGRPSPKTKWAEDAIRLRDTKRLSDEEIGKIVNRSASRVKAILALHRPGTTPRRNEGMEDTSVAERKFDVLKAYRDPETKTLKHGYIIRCGNDACGQVERFLKASGAVNPTHAAQWFRNKGWIVGAGPRSDRCPDHARNLGKPPQPKEEAPKLPNGKHEEEAIENIDAVSQVVESVEVPPSPPANGVSEPEPAAIPAPPEPKKEDLVPLPARAMKREERRIIFAKLEDVYADEDTGYMRDWNDKKVAADLGVPVEWVAEVRDMNFGPERNEQYIAGLIAQAREKGQEILDINKEIQELRDRINSDTHNLNKRMKDYDTHFETFRRLFNTIAP